MNPTRLGLAHALAMPLGSWDLRVPHSISIAVTLPVVMKFNYSAAPESYAAVARALGENVDGMAPLEAAERSVAAVRALSSDVGIPKGLGEYGVRAEHVGRVVVEAMKSGNVPVNPKETSAAQLEQILRNSL
jgi:alcohol dehydrogenase